MIGFICAVAWGLGGAASAAEPPLRHLLYEASWAGLPAGHIALAWRDADRAFAAEMRIVTAGLPRWFTKFKGVATVDGAIDGERFLPRAYEAVYDLRKRHDKRNSILFRGPPGDRLAYRGPADTSDKVELEAPYRRNVLDPLTTFVAISHQIQRGQLRVGDSFTFAVYDSSRRFDAEGRVAGRAQVDLPGGGAADALVVRLILRPVAGFRSAKDADEDPEDTPRPVTLYVSADGRATPLRAEIPIAFFTAVIKLTADCGDRPCALPQ